MSPRVIGLLLVLAASLFETGAQAAMKRGAGGLLHTSRGRRYGAAAILLFGASGVVWTLALQRLDLSVAQPAGSVTIAGVAVASRWGLRERISARRWAGIALILAGVALVGAS